MCGICGIVEFNHKKKISPRLIRSMTKTLTHRGPDDEGIWCEGNGALGFRRLSIIDLSRNGNQPFVNESEDIYLLCNGEIYNYQQLRISLIKAGHQFKSHSDCEVCLHSYEEYGVDFVNYLNGMFAIAILDQKKHRLLLVRDRLGIKPLYYCLDARGIRFASELKSILADPNVKREIDPLALNLYFVRDVIPAPYTIYKGICKLLPGEILFVDLKKGAEDGKHIKYWQPDFTPDWSRTEASFHEELLELLKDAVSIHTISDVPVGLFLSGGLDSSTIFAFMRNGSTSPVETFNIRFDDQKNDESDTARRLAHFWGAHHHELRLEKINVVDILNKVVHFFDEPFGDSSAIPTYQVSEMARKHVKVVLSGDGGDELFGGYITGRGARNIKLACSLPDRWRIGGAAFLHRFTPSVSMKRLQLPTWLMTASLQDHFLDPLCREILQPAWRVSNESIRATYKPLKETLSDLEPVNAYFAGLIAQYLSDDILTKVDRASSAHGLETRVPLLDYRIVELAARIPPRMKFKGKHAKHILRQAMAGRLPQFILQHAKRGFGIPPGYWNERIWIDRLQQLRGQCPAIENIINFSKMKEWDGSLTWRALFLATWIFQQQGNFK